MFKRMTFRGRLSAILLYHAKRNQRVTVVGHSQGNLSP